jgi:hypothetical protein
MGLLDVALMSIANQQKLQAHLPYTSPLQAHLPYTCLGYLSCMLQFGCNCGAHSLGHQYLETILRNCLRAHSHMEASLAVNPGHLLPQVGNPKNSGFHASVEVC